MSNNESDTYFEIPENICNYTNQKCTNNSTNMTNINENENLNYVNYLKISNSNTQDALFEISNETFLQKKLKDAQMSKIYNYLIECETKSSAKYRNLDCYFILSVTKLNVYR